MWHNIEVNGIVLTVIFSIRVLTFITALKVLRQRGHGGFTLLAVVCGLMIFNCVLAGLSVPSYSPDSLRFINLIIFGCVSILLLLYLQWVSWLCTRRSTLQEEIDILEKQRDALRQATETLYKLRSK